MENEIQALYTSDALNTLAAVLCSLLSCYTVHEGDANLSGITEATYIVFLQCMQKYMYI